MDQSDVEFLTDRERECLREPDRFDESDREEIFKRVREKVEVIEDDLLVLQQSTELWDTMEPAGGQARLTCTGCGRTETVDRVTAEAAAKDLTGRPEGWHYTAEAGAIEEPQPFRGVCPECWGDWSEAARELAPERVPCLDENHEPHEVDLGAVARYLDDDHRPAHTHVGGPGWVRSHARWGAWVSVKPAETDLRSPLPATLGVA